MIYWLVNILTRDASGGGYFTRAGLGFRLAAAGACSFVLVLLLGPKVIRFLVRKKIGDCPEFDHADLNEITRHKSNTPTMGGVLIVAAVFFSVLLFADLRNMYIKSGLFALLWLGVLGGVDDWLKLRAAAGKGGRDGLKTWEKLVFQIGLAVLLSNFVYRYGQASYVYQGENINPAHSFFFPFRAAAIDLSLPAYAIIMTLTMVGASNSVNLTDGMDGLASGCLALVVGVLLLAAWIVGVQDWSSYFHMPFVRFSAEMTVFCSAMLGACLGFLWYNAHPASVFMGDTGSLPMGGLIGFIAVVTRQELMLLLAGGVFALETISVVMQVGFFKWTRARTGTGRRIFRCAPIHHHFHLGGWPETRVVMRFWILGLIFAALALATLKLR